ncbi:putative Outer membrane efflux protein [Candidatus Zixiibacteriota bacterium]|nr:putative Outer membrane efflux protein [candidate division Zixibacteria bacterium]
MKIQTIILGLLPIIVMPIVGLAQVSDDSLTMEQSIKMVLENHPLVQQAMQAESAAAARTGASRSAYFPDITFSGDYTRLGPVASIELGGEPFDLYPANNYDLHLGLHQTIYDFGKTRVEVDASRSGQKSAADYLTLVKSNLAYQTIAVFNAILILHQNISVLDEQIGALNEHLEVAQKKVQAGTATDYDVLTTKVRIAMAQDEKIDAANALTRQEIIFRQLTGIPQQNPIILKGDFSASETNLNQDSLLTTADSQRPELTLAHDAENVASIQKSLASLGDKPSLAFDFTSGFKNGYVPNLNEWKANYTAGLLLKIPIFSGHKTGFHEKEAEANLYSARARTADVQRQIKSEVEQALAAVNSSREKIQNAELQVRQAQDALTLARARYEAGVITNLDLLDTQTTLSQAKLVHLRAVYNYTVSRNALDRASGKKIW